MYNICFYFFMFICFSVMGWVVECISCSLLEKKFVHDRGFLIGPYCPIYGFGAMYMLVFLERYHDDPITLFVMAVVGTSLIEFMTSLVMEKIFKARWWDYSNEPFNIEGRVCLRNSILFGILGVAFIYFINPAFLYLVGMIPNIILIIISLVLFILFLTDNIVSFSIMAKLKSNLVGLKKDSTHDIDKQVKEILAGHQFYFKKLFRSFPKIKITLPTGEQIQYSIYGALDSFDKMRRERKEKYKQLKKELKLQKKNQKK